MTRQIVFDHRGRTKAGNEGPLEVRITYNGKPYYINTDIRVRGREFRHGEIVNRGDARALNERLQMVAEKIDRAVTRCIERGDAIDVAAIKKRIYEIDEEEAHESTSMIDWIREQIDMLNVVSRTRDHFKVLVKRMEMFGKLNRWQDLSVERIYEWDAWLHTLTKPQSNADIQAGREPKRIGDGAVHNYHKDLRSMLNRAKRFGKIDENPYDRLHGEFKKKEKESTEYLTEEEMKAFESLHPAEGTQMAMARDLFVFQMYTGLSYSDAQAFDITNYKKITVGKTDGHSEEEREDEGDKKERPAGRTDGHSEGGRADEREERWVNVGERIKTGVAYVSQLLPPVIDVLERYGWKAPKIDNAKYNKCLKTLGMAAGIKTPLHSHLARHTFATWMLGNGVPIEHVSKMIGHTNIRQTQRYAKVVPTAVYDDFEKVAKKMVAKKNSKKMKGGDDWKNEEMR